MEALISPGLLLLRTLIAAIFATSGWSHVARPKERAESIGLPPAATVLLGLCELVGAASVLLGFLPSYGAALLIVVMAGAIYKKVAVWRKGFWGEESNGWYYDLLYATCSFLILVTGGGAWTLTAPWTIA